MNYFKFIAQDVREILAQLGVSKLTDLIGRTELLEIIEGKTAQQRGLDLSKLLYSPKVPDGVTVIVRKLTQRSIKAYSTKPLWHKAKVRWKAVYPLN